MSYSGEAKVRDSREALGNALAALQNDSEIPEDVMAVVQIIAQSIGALFEAERASSEIDGKACVKKALGSLSQTLALLQDVRTQHQGVEIATEVIAEVMSDLYALTSKPSRFPKPRSSTPPAVGKAVSSADSSAPSSSADSSAPSSSNSVESSSEPQAGIVEPGTGGNTHDIGMNSGAEEDTRDVGDASTASGASDAGDHPVQEDIAQGTSSAPDLPTQNLEINIGATTESNFYVGFSGEVSQGGVFLSTYEVLAKSTPVHMFITLPGGFEFRATGFVRFVRDPMDFSAESEPGMGVQFDELPEHARDLVLRFIRKRPPMFYDE